MIADIVNGVFEATGSVAVWYNVANIVRDRGYAGTRLSPMVFFWSWGLWNLYYYPHLSQWASFAGGISIGLANTCYIFLMLKYGRRK